ncbi:hypothetical protein [Streptomyces sp. NPDC086182]|uniref:hypothetical protein n=1 Tax=Streptomyces sp. NPDC086182 TaxID=3155058 RepID=UPI00342F26D1
MRAVMAVESLKENPYFIERAKEITDEVTYLPARPDQDELRDLLVLQQHFDVFPVQGQFR